MRQKGVINMNFLDNNDKRFFNLNTRCKDERNIIERNQADPISADDEKLLWEKLLNTVFY